MDFSKENEKAENESDNSLDELELDAFDDNQSESETLDDSSQEKIENDFDFDADFEAENTPQGEQASVEKAEIDEESLLDFQKEESTSQDNESDYELKIDFEETKETAEDDELKVELADQETDTESLQRSDSDNMLDFSVDSSTFDLSDESIKDDEKVLQKNSSDDGMNIPDMTETHAQSDTNLNSPSDSEEQSSEIDFSGIDLDIEKKIPMKFQRIQVQMNTLRPSNQGNLNQKQRMNNGMK